MNLLPELLASQEERNDRKMKNKDGGRIALKKRKKESISKK
jgi:hypothetical protein